MVEENVTKTTALPPRTSEWFCGNAKGKISMPGLPEMKIGDTVITDYYPAQKLKERKIVGIKTHSNASGFKIQADGGPGNEHALTAWLDAGWFCLIQKTLFD